MAKKRIIIIVSILMLIVMSIMGACIYNKSAIQKKPQITQELVDFTSINSSFYYDQLIEEERIVYHKVVDKLSRYEGVV